MAGATQSVPLFGAAELTTTNGTGADGTGAGAYHRRVVEVGHLPRFGFQWLQLELVGSAAINFYVTCGACKREENLVPPPNVGADPAWVAEPNYLFLSYPTGAKNSEIPLQVSAHGIRKVLVEIVVAVDMTKFDLLFFGGED